MCCALNAVIVCLCPMAIVQGSYSYGILGLGSGSGTKALEDVTDVIDFGTGFEPALLACGYEHCCTASTVNVLKCWGYNSHGQLGLGDTDNRGKEDGQMGDNLEAVELPDGFVVAHILPITFSTCVMSTEFEIVCWGNGEYGTLGRGDGSTIGDGSGEMGNDLKKVDLGADFDVAQLGGGGRMVCAISSDGKVKWCVSCLRSVVSSLVMCVHILFICATQLGEERIWATRPR